MKTITSMMMAVAAACALGVAVPATAADCTQPQGTAQERACAKAAEGATALRRFTERTAPIYQVSFADYAVNVVEPAAVAKVDAEAVKVAQR